MSQHARSGGETRRGRSEISHMSNIALRDGDVVTPADRGREFWRGVLLAGGSTVLPRWTLNPVPGVHEHDATIPDELVAALRRLANELAVPLREVLLDAARAEAELLAHKDFPVDDLRGELGLIKPLFETVFALTAGDGAELAEETVLRVAFVEHDGLVLRLRCKTDVLDAECAARIAGYHRTALAGAPGRCRRRARRHPVDVPGAQRSCQSAGTSSVGARAVSRRCRRSGDRTQSGLDGRCARDLQGRWRVLTHRAAFPGRPHREDAFPGWLPARAHRTRQHRHARPGARLAVRGPDALHRRVIRRGPRRR